MTTLQREKASRHRGIKASGRTDFVPCRVRLVASRPATCGFSLIEVLLAIFILGVGVISIAALFPAGIVQQRLSVDEIMGPIVANSAISTLRGKLKADDFGTFEEFTAPTTTITVVPQRPTIPGDWTWLRPSVLLGDDITPPPTGTFAVDDHGAIDIFSTYSGPSSTVPTATEFPRPGYRNTSPVLYGIPFNRAKYGSAPRIKFYQTERYYPQISKAYGTSTEAGRPQYVWDCMFRRYEGRILVAIFVYRVNLPGSGSASYVVGVDSSNPSPVPPVPVWLDLKAEPGPGGAQPPYYSAGGRWNSFGAYYNNPFNPTPGSDDDNIVWGTKGGTIYNADDPRQSWQEPRQWIIDQNNNIHRVLSQKRNRTSDPVEVELVRPPPAIPNIPLYWLNREAVPAHNPSTFGVVSDIWYIPTRLRTNLDNSPDGTQETEVSVTPVYATVKEL